jgi:MinD-like ATPase involved in chromosome partitioning or flagellar assembly
MSKIVSIHSFRGGTGKSNISANVAAQLALQGKRVGIIDTDIQSPGIHVLFGMDENSIETALNDYLWGRCTIEEAAYDVSTAVKDVDPETDGALHLIPSSVRADEIAQVLREGYDVRKLTDGFEILLDKLDLDYLIIDTHPGVNEETLLSVAISDVMIIVLRPDQQDFQGTAVTVDVARRLGVPNMYLTVNMALSSYSADALKQKIEATYDCPVITVLPLSEPVAQAASSELFSLTNPLHPFSKGVKEIAARIEAVE